MSKILRKMTRALLPIRSGRRFGRDEKGSTAAEFGLLALPFFAIIGAILETSMVFFASQVLDSATQDAARKIRTGEAQGAGFTLANFRTELCSGLYSLFDCAGLRINVNTIADFNSINANISASPTQANCDPATDANQCWSVTNSFAPGQGSNVVLVQVYYRWPTIINFAGFNLANQPDGARLLSAVRVFQNEPFS